MPPKNSDTLVQPNLQAALGPPNPPPLPGPPRRGLRRKTPKQLEKEGFPTMISAAFESTADRLNSVIMSRVPGGDKLQLIEEAYDLKGYFIKAKSSTWGPMAGFLCHLPPFGKNGASGIEFNTEKNTDYLKNVFYVLNPANNDSPKRSPFVPLRISETRKREVLEKYLSPNCYSTIEGDVVGVATDKKRSVIVEFLIRKQGNLYELYHGSVFVKDPAKATILPYTLAEDLKINDASHQRDMKTAEIRKLDVELKKGIPGYMPSGRKIMKWSPIRGIQNPFPPYSGTDTYKNAVSGDYDLFAVWPHQTRDEAETVRVTEMRAGLRNKRDSNPYSKINLPVAKAAPEATSRSAEGLFVRDAWKKFSIRSIQTPNLYLEVIPHYKEITPLENDQLGNVNDLVFLAAQTLNSFVAMLTKSKQAPNRAFHSDEGGRPGVDEIEFPIAAFLPVSIAPRRQCLIINTHEQFLQLINLVKGQYRVLLNFGWYVHWCSLLESRAELNAAAEGGESQKYFAARLAERDKLAGEKLGTSSMTRLAEIRALVEEMVKGDHEAYYHTDGDKRHGEAFDKLVNTFVEFAKDMKTLSITKISKLL